MKLTKAEDELGTLLSEEIFLADLQIAVAVMMTAAAAEEIPKTIVGDDFVAVARKKRKKSLQGAPSIKEY
jgi:hypothetical protein